MRTIVSSAAAVVAALWCVIAVAEERSGLSEVAVFVPREAGRNGYRIPAVIRVPNGDLLAFAEGRNKNLGDAGDIDLVMKRSSDGGRAWGEMKTLWDDGENTCGNPCPVVDEKTGVLHLLLTHNLGRDDENAIKKKTATGTRTVWAMSSRDSGATWSKPREITHQVKDPNWGWYATGPGVGIQIKSGEHAGRLVIPCDHSYDLSERELDVGRGWGAHAIYSDDGGESWKIGGVVRPHANECQIAEISGGRLLLDMRSYSGRKRRLQAVSDDGGATFGEAKDAPELIEPVCQASLIRLRSDDPNRPAALSFSNPAHEKERAALTLRLSEDDGKTWPHSFVLHAGPAAYSCLVDLGDGSIGCLYEGGDKKPYESIRFARLPLESVRDASAVKERK